MAYYDYRRRSRFADGMKWIWENVGLLLLGLVINPMVIAIMILGIPIVIIWNLVVVPKFGVMGFGYWEVVWILWIGKLVVNILKG